MLFGPDVLVALALLLRVVTPVHGVPVEVDADVVLERGPDRRPRIGGGRIDRDRAAGRPAAVVEPELPPARALRRDAIERESLSDPQHQMSIAPSERARRRRCVTKIGSARPGPGFEWTLSASVTMCGYSGARGSSGM